MARALDRNAAFKQFRQAWIKGGLYGASIAALPGLFALIVVQLLKFPYLGAYIGNLESSSVLFWLGVVVGGSAGVIVGTIVTATHLVIDAILQAEEGAIAEATSIPLPGRR